VSVWIDLDLSFDMLQIDSLRRRCRVLGDGAALPFVSGSFDAVIIKFALHHIRDAAHLFSELARVLKRGGICVVVDPFFSESAIDRVRLAVLIAIVARSCGNLLYVSNAAERQADDPEKRIDG
jgi:ubiquinone/menaquinone biosynthesis C-methylase UbiE